MNTEPKSPGRLRRLHARLHARTMALLREDTRPVRLGVAVGVGVLFGCSPFYGFQMLLALLVAWPLKLNKVAVLAGTQISLPPLIPLLVFGGANLGELMLHQRLLPLNYDELSSTPAKELLERFLLAWTVGGLTLGAVLGVALGALTTSAARKLQQRDALTRPAGPANASPPRD